MGSGIFEDRGPVGSPESEIWEWFSAALGWTLFNLPVDSFLLLNARGELSAQFARGSTALYCEVVAEVGEQAADTASARLRALGWDTPDPDAPCNWRLQLPWPARFSEYERVGAIVVAAMREIQELWLPLELTAETWTEGTDERADLGLLSLGNYALEELRAASPSVLADFARANRKLLEMDRAVAKSSNEIRTILGLDYLRGRNAEILTGSNASWPVRDRTVDFIGRLGENHLLVVDVILDVEDLSGSLDFHCIDDRRVQRGTEPFVRAMVCADPDLPPALAGDEVRIDYRLMVMDTDQNIRVVEVGAVDRRTGSQVRQTPSRPRPAADRLADVYPLLKPSNWPEAAQAPHFTLGSEQQRIVIAYAHNLPDRYQVILDDHPEATDERLSERALANLTALQYEWQFIELQWLRVATCAGHTFSAEKLLDPAALRQAHRLLGTQEIIVSVPRRTLLFAFPRHTLDTMESTQQMLRLVSRTYADDSDGNAPITTLLFVVRDGEPVGLVDPDDQASSRRHYRAR